MRNAEENKGTMKMTTKKLLTVLTALLLTVLPMHGLSAANADAVDTTLAVFQVDGNDVEDQDVVVVAGGTETVTVVATPTDADATVDVTGGTDLVPGENTVLVRVTGADGITFTDYTVTVFVTNVGPEFSHDVSLADLKVNGVSINPNQMVEVAPLTHAVTVEVYPNSEAATSVVAGALNLVTGVNTVSITVTAEDGVTTKIYTFKVRVLPLSSDVALATFTVNGQSVRSGGRVFLAPDTHAVNVVAEASDPTSSVVVAGATGLENGANTLTVTVTSESGAVGTYTVTLNVDVPSAVSSLAVFKVSGVRVVDGSTMILPAGTEAVAVTAIPSDGSANVVITGNADLVIGDNALSVVVTAEDGTTTSTYSVTLRVLANDDTSLATFQYDGSDVADGDVIDLDYGTEAVEITAEPTTNLSTVEILGATGLVPGKNTVRVNVTAQDGSIKTYRLFFNVALNSDNTLESITVATQVVGDGDSIDVPFGTRAVNVSAVTTDPFALYAVEGNTDLETGENTVTITVTAVNGETAEYTVTVNVLEQVLSDETGIDSIKVGESDVADGATVEVPAGTRAVAVSAVTTDAYATYVVEGNTDLQTGENTVTITVTAANGDTADYSVTVNVLEQVLSDETGVDSIKVAGQDVADGDSIDMPLGTRAVTVVVVTTDSYATYMVEGNTDLEPGDTDVTITVTAANGDTADYTVTVKIPVLSDDTSVAVLQVNGKDVADGDTLDLPNGSRSVNVKVETTDVNATYMVTGATSLVTGSQDMVITVTAQNGDSATYTITLNVLELSKNTNLDADAGIEINGEAIDFELVDSANFYDVERTATAIAIKVQAEDQTADVFVNDKEVLPGVARNIGVVVGPNDVKIKVIPQAGPDFAATYTLKVYVGGADTSIKTSKVGNTNVTFVDGEATLTPALANATVSTKVYIEPNMALKVGAGLGTEVVVSGDGLTVTKDAAAFTWNVTGLVSGDNLVTVTVNPGDPNAEPTDYSLTIPVAYSSDKTLKNFVVNGVNYPAASTLVLPLGTTEVEYDAVTNHPNATYEIEGGDALNPGLNTLKVTITAEDGESTGEYTMTLIVPKGKDVIVVGFPKADVVTIDAKTNKAGNTVLANEVKKLTGLKATILKVEIANDFVIAKEKNKKAGAARAAAIQKFFQTAKLTNAAKATYSLIPFKLPKAKGVTVNIIYY